MTKKKDKKSIKTSDLKKVSGGITGLGVVPARTPPIAKPTITPISGPVRRAK